MTSLSRSLGTGQSFIRQDDRSRRGRRKAEEAETVYLLPGLIGLCLAFDILQIDQFWYGWVDIDVMASIDAGELEPKRFSARHRISKPDIS